jgi:hypothetical protein
LIDKVVVITALNLNYPPAYLYPSLFWDPTGSRRISRGRRSTMTIGGFVTWRGNPINREVHGGVRAAWFMYGKTLYVESLLCRYICPDMQYPSFLFFKLLL